MKEYQKKVIESLGRKERLEALDVMQLSPPEILDHMIARLEKGIAGGVGPYTPQSTIDHWSAVLVLLKSARAL